MILREMSAEGKRRGFTVIELLIVIAITIVIAGATIPIYGNLEQQSRVDESSREVMSLLRSARTRSVARVNNSAHGVYFDTASSPDRVILYQGDSYDVREAEYDLTLELVNAIQLQLTISGNDINFSKGLGVPSTTGTTSLVHSVGRARDIFINSVGSIDENASSTIQ